MDRPPRRRRLVTRALASVAALAAMAGAVWARQTASEELAQGRATVVDVVDGDTLVVRLAGGRERVRLLGIDTPESVDPRRPPECFGPEAARFTATLAPPGSTVRLVRDVEARDHFGRLLAYVYRQPGDVFVNLRLVEEGYALAIQHPPNLAHAGELVAAGARARSAGRGLWGEC